MCFRFHSGPIHGLVYPMVMGRSSTCVMLCLIAVIINTTKAELISVTMKIENIYIYISPKCLLTLTGVAEDRIRHTHRFESLKSYT